MYITNWYENNENEAFFAYMLLYVYFLYLNDSINKNSMNELAKS